MVAKGFVEEPAFASLPSTETWYSLAGAAEAAGVDPDGTPPRLGLLLQRGQGPEQVLGAMRAVAEDLADQ